MRKAMIICHSQTEAFKCQRLLEGAGVHGRMLKPPREMNTSSCSWAIRVDEAMLPTVNRRLTEKNFAPVKIVTYDDASLRGR